MTLITYIPFKLIQFLKILVIFKLIKCYTGVFYEPRVSPTLSKSANGQTELMQEIAKEIFVLTFNTNLANNKTVST